MRHESPRVRALAVVCVPIIVAIALCVPKLWQGDFTVDTGWYAAISLQAYRGVAESGLASWWSLQGSGSVSAEASDASIQYFNKPPLAFWLNGLPLWAFGPTIWAARLGSVVAAVLCVAVTSMLASRHSGPRVGRASGLILALTIPFMGLARSFSLDLWLATLLMLALGSLIGLSSRPNAWARISWSPIAYAGLWLGLSLLTKPLVGLLAVPIIGVWMLWCGRGRAIGRLVPAVILAAILACVWHVAMVMKFGDAFMSQYFGREMADRAAGDRSAAVFNTGATSFFYYAKVLAEGHWPWLVTLILALAALVRQSGWQRASSGNLSDRDVLKLGLVWTMVWLLALSVFADKRPRYLAPLFPVCAWMSALWLCRGGWGAPAGIRRGWRQVTRWTPPIAVVGAIALSVAPIRLHKPEDPQWLPILSWLDAHPDVLLYQGGLAGQRAAKVYLHRNRWPRPTTDASGARTIDPPPGAYVLYHARDMLRPGVDEEIVVESGFLKLTRLIKTPWRPAPNTDPGE